MNGFRRLLPIACLAALPVAAPAAAQRAGAQATTPPADSTVPSRPLIAAVEALFVNVAVNRWDAWVKHDDWARVGVSDWRRNLRLGWEWDENGFTTNMFAHPYNGGLYFNAGRANGLDFWESVPLAFLGSWSWEYFGETFRPSLNDFFMTSFGGITLGEVFHRLGASIRDNRLEGGARLGRELASLPLDPVNGLNRLLRGEWTRTGPNPPEHNAHAYVLRVASGLRSVADSGIVDSVDSISSSPTILVELQYGDPLRQPWRQPFDVFSVRLQVSPGGGGLNLLRASGRLWGRDLNRLAARHRHVFAVNQRYDYVSNPAHKFGAQSIEAGLYSRWHVHGESGLRTTFLADAILLGALDAPYSGTGERTYDFGPGLGFRAEASFEHRGITYLTLYGRTEYVHSVSGASADHNVHFGGIEATVPVALHLGIGLHSGYYRRLSRYPDRPDETREFPEVRLFVVWTGAVLRDVTR